MINHPYRILLVGSSGWGKPNTIFNPINHLPHSDKIFLYAKDHYDSKNQYLIKSREEVAQKYLKDPKPFINYSSDTNDVYKATEQNIPRKKCYVLIVFDDMITDMTGNKKLHPVVTELFTTGMKLNIFSVFIIQSYFLVQKDVCLSNIQFSSRSFQIDSSSNKLLIIIRLIMNTYCTGNVLQNHLFGCWYDSSIR